MIVLEKSASWAKLLTGEIPEEIDVYLLFWVDPVTQKIVDYGSYLATSEPGPIGTDALVAAEIRVPVATHGGNPKRTMEDVVAAHGVAYEILARKLVYDASLRQLFDRLVADLRDGHCKAKTDKVRLPTDIVSEKDFAELMRTAL